MTPTSSSLSSPYVNEHDTELYNVHDNGLDNMGGYVSPMVIDLTDKSSPSASDDCDGRYNADSATD